jgi:hypothetical protein
MGLKHFALIVMVAGVPLAGCSGIDGVDLNGRVFDMLGVSNAAQEAGKREPRLEPRQGLVVPPTVTAALPSPGSGAVPDPNQDVRDHDQQKRLAAAERARLHKAYCSGEMTWKERATNRDARDATPTSPYGPCTLFGDQLNDGNNPKKSN